MRPACSLMPGINNFSEEITLQVPWYLPAHTQAACPIAAASSLMHLQEAKLIPKHLCSSTCGIVPPSHTASSLSVHSPVRLSLTCGFCLPAVPECRISSLNDPWPQMYAVSLFSFSLSHWLMVLFICTYWYSRNTGYKTLAHYTHATSVGLCLESPFHLFVVLSTVAHSRGHCPHSIPSKWSVPLFIHLPPPSLGPFVPSPHMPPLCTGLLVLLFSCQVLHFSLLYCAYLMDCYIFLTKLVTDLHGPPLMQANRKKIDALKRCVQEIARDLRSRGDVQISYLETLEERDNDNLGLAQMLAG
jgi:hypothetical protein